MFTGIITGMGRVASLKRKGRTATLSLRADLGDVKVGDSISINGTCLTVTHLEKGIMDFDLSDETLNSTNLGELKPEDPVNLEPSLSANGKLGGHFVTGHVDAVGIIKKKIKDSDIIKLEISAPQHVMSLLVHKGSITVDGISLTVVDVLRDSFTVVIIPYTAEVTSIGIKGVGSSVNIETDIIGKYVMKYLKKEQGLMETLKAEGFLEKR